MDTEGLKHQWSDRIYVRIKRRDIAYLRFLVEGYDHLAYMTVLDKYEADIQLTFSPDQQEELFEFIQGISQDMSMLIFEIPKIRDKF